MIDEEERLRRWRLVLGAPADEPMGVGLSTSDLAMDGAMSALYDEEAKAAGGLGASAPRVARWLGDIRAYFPSSVVQVMQRDAIDRLQLTSMLLEPELLDSLQPDV